MVAAQTIAGLLLGWRLAITLPSILLLSVIAGRLLGVKRSVGASLLSGVMWNQSSDSPEFTNFIDGTNASFLGRAPWGLGAIYFGWIALGAVVALAVAGY